MTKIIFNCLPVRVYVFYEVKTIFPSFPKIHMIDFIMIPTCKNVITVCTLNRNITTFIVVKNS